MPRSESRRAPRWIAGLVWAAAAASAVLLVVVVIDQTSGQRLLGYTEAAYARHGVTPDPAAVYTILYAVTIAIAVLWALLIPLSRLQGRRGAALSASATIVTGALALLMLTATEYGERVFSPVWGLLALIPVVLGVVATALLTRGALTRGRVPVSGG